MTPHDHPLLAYKHARGARSAGPASAPASGSASGPERGWAPGRRVPTAALVEFTRSFAVMVKARLPLVEALGAAAEQARHRRLRRVLEDVEREVRRGRSLSDAFGRHPHVFGGLYAALTRVGEAAGLLDVVLGRLATHAEKAAHLRRKVRLALVYPGLVLAVAAAATAFLLTAVVPTFAEMFADFGAELPAPTRLVLRMSGAVTDHALLLGALALGGGGGLWAGLRTPRGRLLWDRLALGLPLLGPLLRRSLTARFCRTTGTLLQSGVPLLDALTLVRSAAGNRLLEREIDGLIRSVRKGASLRRGLRGSRAFPALVVQMMAVGERTAELDELLLHAADHYEQEVEMAVDALAATLEPVLIVVIGLVLGGILTALYLPMFDMVTVVG